MLEGPHKWVFSRFHCRALFNLVDESHRHNSDRLIAVISTRTTMAPWTAGWPALLIGLLAGLCGPRISGTELGTATANPSSVQIRAAKGPAAQASEEARWLAVRYATEAEHHFFEAIRYEEQAIQIDPVKDSRGTSRNQLLSKADSHWTRMFDLRTRAQLSRVEASQHAVR